MRVWSLHPRYLDARGLVALWREGLLAQAVLAGHTRGYTRHPQLVRFRDSSSPLETIATYLLAVHAEATCRGYHFDAGRVASPGGAESIAVTQGQLAYEWAHLKAKLRVRDPARLVGLEGPSPPEPHPLFHLVPGPVAPWEVVAADGGLVA